MSQDKKSTGVAPAAGDRAATGTAPSRAKTHGSKVHGKDRDMGSALRSVYQRAVDEPVPDDLLDLLGKLG